MLTRNERGKLSLTSLDLEIFFADLFEACKTEKEVQWLQKQLEDCVEVVADERLDEIERGLI